MNLSESLDSDEHIANIVTYTNAYLIYCTIHHMVDSISWVNGLDMSWKCMRFLEIKETDRDIPISDWSAWSQSESKVCAGRYESGVITSLKRIDFIHRALLLRQRKRVRQGDRAKLHPSIISYMLLVENSSE